MCPVLRTAKSIAGAADSNTGRGVICDPGPRGCQSIHMEETLEIHIQSE